ncbi:hypothetical protein [Terribacillus saccharophilus]|uniref:hypothetical protein n=1 Tax=Terribacillus saccharophilus TaxID=361277 RepID=UPI000BA71A8A|nr:hypothetical protein [Terribacillus saccharophilus]PAF15932.1 hypothetical protein CHH51_18165 [Terribacillus saccharophilus]
MWESKDIREVSIPFFYYSFINPTKEAEDKVEDYEYLVGGYVENQYPGFQLKSVDIKNRKAIIERKNNI